MSISFFLALFFALFSVIGLGVGLFGPSTDSHGRPTDTRAGGVAVFVAAGLVAAIFTVVASTTIVDVGHAGIKVRFGTVTGQTSNGFKIHAPWEQIVSIDTRLQEFTAAGDGTAEGVDSAAISCPTKDDSTVTADLTVRWELLNSAADEMYGESGLDYESKFVLPAIRSTFRDTCVEFNALDARANRIAVAARFEDLLRDRIGVVELGGVSIPAFAIEGVDVRNVRLEQSVAAAANRKLEAEQAAAAASFELERTLIEAEITRAESAALYDGQQIIACGYTTSLAEDGSTQTIANGNEDCDDNLTPEVLTWRLIETLPDIGKGAGDTIFVPFPDLLNGLGSGETFQFTNPVGGE
jgi:regulator of protease activity HflC (stomatin/prohibitin superfamily)